MNKKGTTTTTGTETLVVKKVVKKKAVTRKVVKKKALKKKVATSSVSRGMSDRERYLMIEEHAYYLAEARHFRPGSEHDDWLEAERFVDAMLNKR